MAPRKKTRARREPLARPATRAMPLRTMTAEALDSYFATLNGHKPGHPAVVFLDLKMPKVDGLEVLRQMKSDESLKVIPVVMLTSSREEADLVKSYRLGVNAYVVKPVGFDKFADAIQQLGMFWAVLNEPPPDVKVG